MIEIYKIKSQKLRSLIENSKRFNMLSEEKQKNLLNKINSLPLSEQESKYIPFFEEKNKEETIKLSQKEEKYKALIDKLNEMDRTIKNIAFKDKEKLYRKEEEKEEEKLLEQINNL